MLEMLDQLLLRQRLLYARKIGTWDKEDFSASSLAQPSEHQAVSELTTTWV